MIRAMYGGCCAHAIGLGCIEIDSDCGATGICSPKPQQVSPISAQSAGSPAQQQAISIGVWSLQTACAGSATVVNARIKASKNFSIRPLYTGKFLLVIVI